MLIVTSCSSLIRIDGGSLVLGCLRERLIVYLLRLHLFNWTGHCLVDTYHFGRLHLQLLLLYGVLPHVFDVFSSLYRLGVHSLVGGH